MYRHKQNRRNKILNALGRLCDICEGNKNLHIHHKNAVSLFPTLKNEIENLVIMCDKCHRRFHDIYGNDVTERDYLEFRQYNR